MNGSTYVSGADETRRRQFCARCERLWGPSWRSRLSEGIGADYATVKRWAAGNWRIPDYALAAIELLELTPPKHWPKRWPKPDIEHRAA